LLLSHPLLLLLQQIFGFETHGSEATKKLLLSIICLSEVTKIPQPVIWGFLGPVLSWDGTRFHYFILFFQMLILKIIF